MRLMAELPKTWISAGGNPQLWGKGGTYKVVPFEALPPVEGPFDGTFDWLTRRESPPYGMTFEHQEEEGLDVAEMVDERVAEARELGLVVPEAFVRFAKDVELHSRIPSCTACYWDIASRLVPIPGNKGPGRLLRFMNDQQACYLWYLLLEPGGNHSVVVGYPEWLEEARGDTLEDSADPAGLAVCAPAFEEFVKRVWIEGLLWKANNGQADVDGELAAYTAAAMQAIADGRFKK